MWIGISRPHLPPTPAPTKIFIISKSGKHKIVICE